MRACHHAILILLLSAAPASAATLKVSAASNIFGAGHSSPPGPGGGGAGVLPAEYDFGFTAAPNLFLTFSGIAGTVIVNSGSGNNANDPDGIGANTFSSSVNSLNGLAGITGPRAGYLVGVFETDLEPSNPAPSALNFNLIGTTFSTLAPTLNQVFFIGDGLTGNGSGTIQQFLIPAEATRLFLGLADAPGYHGDPGGYSDNTGFFTASFTINNIPEPSVPALITIGAAFSALCARRLRTTKR
jgi:hypothetical protein